MRKFKVRINSKGETMLVYTTKNTPDNEIYTFRAGDVPSWGEQQFMDAEVEAGRYIEIKKN